VLVLHGTSRGPTSEDAQRWRPGRDGLRGKVTEDCGFGSTLAVGRFTDSGSLDLAVGTPGLDLYHTGGAGAVTVIYGSPHGLRAAGNQQWNEYRLAARIADDDEVEDSPGFGRTLAVGDLGHGPADDLVVGSPGASTTRFEAGAVQVLYGTRDGLTANNTQRIHQRLPGVAGKKSGQHFGESLAVVGPFTDTTPATSDHPLLAIGEPSYRQGGMVLILRSSDEGVLLTGDKTVEPVDPTQRPAGSGFGRRLAAEREGRTVRAGCNP
jgi:hypothetical protein